MSLSICGMIIRNPAMMMTGCLFPGDFAAFGKRFHGNSKSGRALQLEVSFVRHVTSDVPMI
jgi:hypothetical protein